MRYAQIRRLDISNGEGIGIALFTQGCPIHCKGCFNSDTWNMEGGDKYTEETKYVLLKLIEPDYIRRLSILGGEPLIERNVERLIDLITEIQSRYGRSKKIWLYTGQMYEKVIKEYPELIKLVDILIDGPYVEEKADSSLYWRGSSNQRVIDVQETLRTGHIVIYESSYKY